jgi:hypothetical protein
MYLKYIIDDVVILIIINDYLDIIFWYFDVFVDLDVLTFALLYCVVFNRFLFFVYIKNRISLNYSSIIKYMLSTALLKLDTLSVLNNNHYFFTKNLKKSKVFFPYL